MINNEYTYISVAGNKYLLCCSLTLQDSMVFIREFKKTQNSKLALYATIYEKLSQNESLHMNFEDFTSEEESSFSEYINVIINNSPELQKIYEKRKKGDSLVQDFADAYNEYINMCFAQAYDALKPAFENLHYCGEYVQNTIGKSLNEFSKVFNNSYKNPLQSIIDSLQKSMQNIEHQLAEMVKKIQPPSLTEEQKKYLISNYKKWGRFGWSMIEDAPFDLYKNDPLSYENANKIACSFCTKEAMNDVFNNLFSYNVNNKDLAEAIFCYKNGKYKACSLIIFGLIDSILIKYQPITLDKRNRREVGYGAARYLHKKLQHGKTLENTYFIYLYFINLMECLKTFFNDAKDFTLKTNVINRNDIDHGMLARPVKKRDCIQLFLALSNLCFFLSKESCF